MLNRYPADEDCAFRRERLLEVRVVPRVEGVAKEGEGRALTWFGVNVLTMFLLNHAD
jgi:hypothetical protein